MAFTSYYNNVMIHEVAFLCQCIAQKSLDKDPTDPDSLFFSFLFI